MANVRAEDCHFMGRYCASARLRRLSRRMTRHYDRYLGPVGITAAQLPILAALRIDSGCSVRALAERLDLDRSTLSRNLGVLARAGLVDVDSPAGPVPASVRLTSSGQRTLNAAWKAWSTAHAELEDVVQRAEFQDALSVLDRAAQDLERRAPALAE